MHDLPLIFVQGTEAGHYLCIHHNINVYTILHDTCQFQLLILSCNFVLLSIITRFSPTEG